MASWTRGLVVVGLAWAFVGACGGGGVEADGGTEDTTAGDATTDDGPTSGASVTADGSTGGTGTGGGPGSADAATTDDGTSTTQDGTDSDTTDDTGGRDTGICPAPEGDPVEDVGDVDVLFVVDNSGSMGLKQARVAGAIASFVARLTHEGIDYRLAVTTTDVGNPWCNQTGPELGHLVASSCRERLADFVFMGAAGTLDLQDEACLDVCDHDELDIQPTTTDVDAVPAPRPWLQRIDGATNLPGGVPVGAAAACMLPQGINGCGFEQPLEAMHRALLRAQTPDENNYGFLRSHADLMIVIVTDEVDCSYDPVHEAIFVPGDNVFWSDPEANAPTSAVCWNAGVQCVGGPGVYDDCVAASYDEAGNPTDAGNAVMHPLSRYTSMLDDVAATKTDGAVVRLAVVTGVPLDHVDGAPIVYADAIDPMFDIDFGIAPGCGAEDGEYALPPVRLREVAEDWGDAGWVNLDSACAPTYCDAFARIADEIAP